MTALGGIADEILETVYETLSGDTTLVTTLGCQVYDYVPDNRAYPYVDLGEAYSTKDATFSKDARNVLLRLHVWSQYRGSKETWNIIGRIDTLLDEVALTVDGATLEACNVETANVFKDPDGKTRHGVIDVRIQVAES